jgi:hypothetical protein
MSGGFQLEMIHFPKAEACDSLDEEYVTFPKVMSAKS